MRKLQKGVRRKGREAAWGWEGASGGIRMPGRRAPEPYSVSDEKASQGQNRGFWVPTCPRPRLKAQTVAVMVPVGPSLSWPHPRVTLSHTDWELDRGAGTRALGLSCEKAGNTVPQSEKPHGEGPWSQVRTSPAAPSGAEPRGPMHTSSGMVCTVHSTRSLTVSPASGVCSSQGRLLFKLP